MHNYWRTTATELVALTPKAPFMIEEGRLLAPPNGRRPIMLPTPILNTRRALRRRNVNRSPVFPPGYCKRP